MTNKIQVHRELTINDLRFVYDNNRGQIIVASPRLPDAGAFISPDVLLPPLLGQLVGQPIDHFRVINRRSSPGVLAVAIKPIKVKDPVIPVPINCPSLLYPRSFVNAMRTFVRHLFQIQYRRHIDLAGWYSAGEEIVTDILSATQILRLNRQDSLFFELILKTSLAQPLRTD